MKSSSKLLSLAFALAATAWALPAAAENSCLSKNGKFLVKPTDGNYCSCVASLTDDELEKLGITAAQAEECRLTTGSLVNPVQPDNPASVDTPLPGNEPEDGNANNGVGNGVDPAPPGIGNAGNDALGQTPGDPGGSDSAPGK